MNIDTEQYLAASPNLRAAESGEPLTPAGAGTCPNSLSGPFGPGPPWQLDYTMWYAFAATGGENVVTVNSSWPWGLALYGGSGTSTLSDLISCTMSGRLQIRAALGTRLLVQVGQTGFDPVATGILSIASVATNDKREDAIPLHFDERLRVGNFGATLEPGEPTSCPLSGQQPPGAPPATGQRSVWAYVDVAAPGTLLLALAAIQNNAGGILAVYEANALTPIGCSAQTIPPYQLGTQLQVPVHSGRYWVQLLHRTYDPDSVNEAFWTLEAKFTPNLDVDGDGYFKVTDCNDDDPAIHPGALDIPEDGVDQDCSGADAVNFDRDGDTYQRPADCNDGDRTVHPGATEIPDDGIDQNCDGRDDQRDSDRDGVPDRRDRCPHRSNGGVDADHDGCRDPIQLVVTAQVSLSLTGRELHLESLTVRSARGVRIVVTCNRRACQREAVTLAKSYASMGRRFAARVPEGTIVTIAATKPGTLGMVKQYRLSANGVRLVRQWCTSVGERPQRIRCA